MSIGNANNRRRWCFFNTLTNVNFLQFIHPLPFTIYSSLTIALAKLSQVLCNKYLIPPKLVLLITSRNIGRNFKKLKLKNEHFLTVVNSLKDEAFKTAKYKISNRNFVLMRSKNNKIMYIHISLNMRCVHKFFSSKEPMANYSISSSTNEH